MHTHCRLRDIYTWEGKGSFNQDSRSYFFLTGDRRVYSSKRGCQKAKRWMGELQVRNIQYAEVVSWALRVLPELKPGELSPQFGPGALPGPLSPEKY